MRGLALHLLMLGRRLRDSLRRMWPGRPAPALAARVAGLADGEAAATALLGGLEPQDCADQAALEAAAKAARALDLPWAEARLRLALVAAGDGEAAFATGGGKAAFAAGAAAVRRGLDLQGRRGLDMSQRRILRGLLAAAARHAGSFGSGVCADLISAGVVERERRHSARVLRRAIERLGWPGIRAFSVWRPRQAAQIRTIALQILPAPPSLAAMRAGAGNALTAAEARVVLKRMHAVRRRFIRAAPRLPVDCALRLWLASRSWRRSAGMRGALLRRLTGAPIVALNAALNRARAAGFAECKDAALTIAAEGAAGGARRTLLLKRWAHSVATGREETFLALNPTWWRDVFAGAWPLAEVCAVEPLPAPLAAAPDAVISFAPLSGELLDRLPMLRGVALNIRVGSRAASEAPGAVTVVQDLAPSLNSAADHESAADAARAAALAARLMIDIPSDADAWVRETLQLCIEDRLYASIKRGRGVLDRLAGARVVVVVASRGRAMMAFEFAQLLALRGIEARVAFEKLGKLERETVHAAILSCAGGPSGLAPAMALCRRDAPLARRLDIAAHAAPLSRPAGPGGGALVIASLSDSSYLTATRALCRALAPFGQMVIFNGAPRGGDALTAEKGVRLVDPAALGVDVVGLREDVDAAVAALMTALAAGQSPGGTAPGDDDTARAWLSACASRMIGAGSVGLAAELSNAAAIRRIFASARFGALVTVPGRMTCARGATLLARAAGCPSIDVQAFFISRHPRYRASLADVYCAITDDQLDVYRHHNPDPAQRQLCIGSLMIDERLKSVRDLDRGQARALLGLPRRARLLLYCAQHGDGADGDATILMIARAVRRIPDCALIVKLHPRIEIQAVNATRSLLAAEGIPDAQVMRDGDIYALMRAADVVGTRFSNVGLEAAVMGIPVISVNADGRDYVVDLYRMGLAMRVADEQDAAQTIRAILDDPAASAALAATRAAYLARNPALLSSSAAANVAGTYAALTAAAAQPALAEA